MGMTLCRQASRVLPQFTGGQFYLQTADAAVYLVEAQSGKRLQLLAPEDGETDSTAICRAATADAETPVAPEIVDDSVADATRPASDEKFAAIATLSNREYAVFSMIGAGMDMCDIATQLGISVKTVET